jgi:phosphoribosylamine--glycine ligase
MKILVIGGGGREHAIVWKLKQDTPDASLFVAPGNAGTAGLAHNLPIAAADIGALVAWAEKERPDYTWVGPEVPLCAGLVDAFEERRWPIFGPNKKAAQLEGSKSFTKNLLEKYHLPTARGKSFTDPLAAYAYSQKLGFPQVVKADGLAAGKGVIIAEAPEEAARAIYHIMERRVFGAAGAQVLIEEFLTGVEASVHAITDGKTFRLLPAAQDHKKIGEGDTGLNTGGMGAYAPTPLVTPELEKEVAATIFEPLLRAFQTEGIDYRGVLYAGLMLTREGPKILEFNARLGDPETQVLLPLLETPLTDIMQAVHDRTLDRLELRFRKRAAMAVVLAAANYPGEPRLGDKIEGLAAAAADDQGQVFHAGTKTERGVVVTSGGRVLAVTAWAGDLREARERAYSLGSKIKFAGMQYRRDIGRSVIPA